MTRPHIIRADTLDLQDKDSPTAQDHSHQPEHPAPLGIGPAAPHQQAAIRHVEEERTSEEVRLQNAMKPDSGSGDERTTATNDAAAAAAAAAAANAAHKGAQHDVQAVRLNGGVSGEGDDDTDMQDADVEEDMDDDMMDKISSSPSIDDGGYSLSSRSTPWPPRRESLTPISSPLNSTTASSSPFTSTPIHFLTLVATASKSTGTLACNRSPLSTYSIHAFPPSSSSPNPTSTKHHRGEYSWTRTTMETTDDLGDETEVGESPRAKQLSLVQRRLELLREDSDESLLSDLDSEHTRNMVQPMRSAMIDIIDDPFIEAAVNLPRTSNGTPLPRVRHLDGEDKDSWTTDSDADSWGEDPTPNDPVLDDHTDDSYDGDDDDDDDASNDLPFSNDLRLIDSGWGGECLRETEDIDFEFVYALHTFVATVEGQANATKGDTMVLLDDSNSYWWLVRVVKDSSIGYLPAEHIETPTERLARLNKHRNIDLSATMLGDTAEKSKNPLKKAMRRRNAKTVQFAPPTYVEASDYDYSSDEGDGELFGGPAPKQLQQQEEASQQDRTEQEEGLKVQPLKVNGARKEGQSEGDGRGSSDDARREGEKHRGSEDDFDRPLDPKVSRNGTLRNTDSFFKDENTETRKITLTPNLLRDDSSTSTTGSRERGPSLESLEKNGFGDKAKEDKKKKEKKSGMLSGLFKRKDKKSKGGPDSMDSDIEKPEEVDRSSPQSKPSEDSIERSSGEQTGPVRQPSKGKLQKPNRSRDDSPQQTKGILKTESSMEEQYDGADTTSAQPSASMRLVSPDQEGTIRPSTADASNANNPGSRNPFSAAMKSQTNTDPKPEKVKQAKQRIQLDDFDSDDDSNDPFADPDAQPKTMQSQQPEATGRLSESPVHVTAADAQPSQKDVTQEREHESDPRQPPGLTTDNSSQETSSPVATPTPDDSPMQTVSENTVLSTSQQDHESSAAPQHSSNNSTSVPPPNRPAPTLDTNKSEISPPVSSESTMLPAWSDASLRAYLDDGSDIRDMLVVVNDTTGVIPVGPDHPFMKGLFAEETKTMQNMSGELDRLLNGLMEKRMKRAGSGASTRSAGGGTGMNMHSASRERIRAGSRSR